MKVRSCTAFIEELFSQVSVHKLSSIHAECCSRRAVVLVPGGTSGQTHAGLYEVGTGHAVELEFEIGLCLDRLSAYVCITINMLKCVLW